MQEDIAELKAKRISAQQEVEAYIADNQERLAPKLLSKRADAKRENIGRIGFTALVPQEV